MNVLGRICENEGCEKDISHRRLGALTCSTKCRLQKSDQAIASRTYHKLDPDLRLVQVHENRFAQSFCEHCNTMEQFIISHERSDRTMMTCSICFIHKAVRC